MESLPRPLLSCVQGKLDDDLKESTEASWMVPLKAALRQLSMSEAEQEKFTLDIHQYAGTISPEELRAVPKAQLLPYLLSSLWAVHARSSKADEETDKRKSQNESDAEETEGSYETIDEDTEVTQGEDNEDPCADGAEGRGHRKNLADLPDPTDSSPKKYKILLDNVAPFFLEKRYEDIQKFKSGSNYLSSISKTSAAGAGQGQSRGQESENQGLFDPLGSTKTGTTSSGGTVERQRYSRAVWRYTLDHMEPEYRLPTLILKKHLYVKREEPRNLGPGCYASNINCRCPSDKHRGKAKGQMYSCDPRFPKEFTKSDCPDPGAYGDPHVKYMAYVERCKHPGVTPILQSGPCDVRGKTFKTIGSALGPGEYEIKSSIQQLLKKKCGSRGPYDLFSQKNRFENIHGYFKSPKGQLEPGMYEIFGTMKDLIMSRDNINKGKLSKLARDQRMTGERITISNPMWPTAEAEKQPGPCHYNTHEVNYRRVCWDENYYAFNVSSDNVRPELPADYDNAPTRYHLERSNQSYCPKGCGFRSNFKAANPRMSLKRIQLMSERLRAKDIPPSEKRTDIWRPC